MPKSCFIAMPVSTPSQYSEAFNDDIHFQHVLEELMIPAVHKAGYLPIRPIAKGADMIHAEIISQLETADLVLCDISSLNPNVFFELGIRTAVDKPVCIVKDTRTEIIPFDTSVMNVHTYEPSLVAWNVDRERRALAEHLQASAERSNDRNPMWTYFSLTTRAEFRKDESPLEAKMDLLMLALESHSRVEPPPRPAASVVPRNAPSEDDVTAFRRSVSATNSTKHILPVDHQVEILDQAHKIGNKTRISSLSFDPGAIIASYIGEGFTEAERTQLEELSRRYGMQLYLYKQSNILGS